MEDKDLSALKALAQAATPGLWDVNTAGVMKDGAFTYDEVYVYSPAKRNVAIAADVADPDTGEPSVANAQFIAAANPAAILSLIARVEQADLLGEHYEVLCQSKDARIAELGARLERAESMLYRAGFNGDSVQGFTAPVQAADLEKLRVRLKAMLGDEFHNVETMLQRIGDALSVQTAPATADVGGLTPARIIAIARQFQPQEMRGIFSLHHSHLIELGKTIGREVLATTKAASVDLSGLTRYDFEKEYLGDGEYNHYMKEDAAGEYVRFADMQELLATAHPSGAARAQPVGHVVTWNKGGSGEVNSIEPIGKSGYSLAASLPEGTLIYITPPAQAWNGELPEPDIDGYGGEGAYTAETVRKAIGAALAGVARAVRERAVSDEIFVETAVETILEFKTNPASQEAVAAEQPAAASGKDAEGTAKVLVPRATLELIYDVMNHMGDALNEIDAVEDGDVEKAEPAFAAIRDLLATEPAPSAWGVSERFEELVRDLYNLEGGRNFALRLEKLLEQAQAQLDSMIIAPAPHTGASVPEGWKPTQQQADEWAERNVIRGIDGDRLITAIEDAATLHLCAPAPSVMEEKKGGGE